MLSWEEFVLIHHLKKRGWSIRAIANHLGKDRKTIRRYLYDTDLVPGERRSVARLIDPYVNYVDARLEDNRHVAATVLLRELKELGFEGSNRTLARHLESARPVCEECSAPEPAESVMMPHRPGTAQADWSPFYWTPSGHDVEVKIELFAIELCRSHMVYARFFERQSFAHLAAGHIDAFDYFSGTPKEIRYDRTSQVFRKGSDEPTAQFADFAAYYGLKAIPCVPGRSRSKGQIERVFLYVATSFFHTVDAATLTELNAHLRRWLDLEANQRLSDTVMTRPVEELADEVAHLLPVRRPPYPIEVVDTRTVDRYSRVRLDSTHYSVEPGHVGRKVDVVTRPGSGRIEIRYRDRVIGAHERAPKSTVVFDPAHQHAIEAATLKSLHRRRHRRKRNDARVGPKAAEEAAILRARRALGTDGIVDPVDLSAYDDLWKDQS